MQQINWDDKKIQYALKQAYLEYKKAKNYKWHILEETFKKYSGIFRSYMTLRNKIKQYKVDENAK
jgi:cytochrome oxidase Cu insertion factor (SCO1/SenC/PrrC family)